MAKFAVDGVVYEQVEMDRLTLGEIGVLEKVTGLTINAIARKLETCVCDHMSDPWHLPREDDAGDTSCRKCDCPRFSDIGPSEVGVAMMWLSMKRQEPALTYAAAQAITQDSIERVPEPVLEDVDDPKENPSESDEPATSSD